MLGLKLVHRIIKKMGICTLAIALLFGSAMPVLAVTEPYKEITEETILAYADEYDPDGAFILRESLNDGEDILEWWDDGEFLLRGYDTAVHEECHRYTTRANWIKEEYYYLGNQEDILVKYGKFYTSEIMAETIPEQLRGFRYDTYLGEESSKSTGARQSGIYGLLDEYNAYSWGMNATMMSYEYLDDVNALPEEWWNCYVVGGSNGVAAYAEFNYWILYYLLYAKEYEPKVYEASMENVDMIRAYLDITSRFEERINEFYDSLPVMITLLNEKGYSVEITERGIESKEGNTTSIWPIALPNVPQDLLFEEVQKPEYQEILSEMKSKVSDISVEGNIDTNGYTFYDFGDNDDGGTAIDQSGDGSDAIDFDFEIPGLDFENSDGKEWSIEAVLDWFKDLFKNMAKGLSGVFEKWSVSLTEYADQ